jgi:hypothetical protein
MTYAQLFSLIVASLIGLSLNTYATSFDCAKATTLVEMSGATRNGRRTGRLKMSVSARPFSSRPLALYPFRRASSFFMPLLFLHRVLPSKPRPIDHWPEEMEANDTSNQKAQVYALQGIL